MPELSKCPPSDRLTNGPRSLVYPINSASSIRNRLRDIVFPHAPYAGLLSHHPNLTLKTVFIKRRPDELNLPMFDESAEPEIAIAMAKRMLFSPPYPKSAVRQY